MEFSCEAECMETFLLNGGIVLFTLLAAVILLRLALKYFFPSDTP